MSGAALVLACLALLAPAPQRGPAALTGTVQSSDGQPIAGAHVAVVGAADVSATTDASGAFSLASPTLPVKLEVSARGFALQLLTVDSSPVQIVLLPATVTESVIITAELDAGESMIGSSKATLGQLDLARMPGVTLDESLITVSGFSLFRRSTSRASNPTTHGVTLRGLSASGASRGLVLFDGVPLNDGFGAWVTWTRLPALAIGEVTVTKGPQGDAFGSDALGGLIEIDVPSVSDQIFVDGEAGSRDLYGFDTAMGRRVGAIGFFGAASWFRTDGAIPVEPDSRGPVDVPADVEYVNGLGRASFDVDSQRPTRLTLTGWGGWDDRGNGTVLQRNRMSGGTLAADFRSFGRQNTLAARISYSPNSFYQTFSQVAPGRVSETVTSTQNTDTSTTRALIEGGYVFGPAFVLVRGALSRARADFQDVTPASTTNRDLRDDSEAISAQLGTMPIGRVTFGAGVRHEWRIAPETDEGERDQATVGHVQATIELPHAMSITGSVATSHRWPTLNELVRNFQAGAVRTLANPDLAPERALSGEVGTTFRIDRWTTSATFFSTVIDDAIANVTIGTNLRQRQNAGDARAYGLELAADGGVNRVHLRGTVTLTNATFQNSTEPAIEDKWLPQVPRVSGSVWATIQLPYDLQAAVIWHSLSHQFDDDRNNFELAPSSQIDVKLSGRRGRMGWYLAFTNMFDNRIEVG
ncbi:MAG TPA: TonB-dependent receptor, partial [Vicinamibacterales bacterium]|nr:TonB-dependent receptor [Vicinamibacterales bacterium]